MNDLISRLQAAEALITEAHQEGAYGYLDAKQAEDIIMALPSAQPERLTDDDFETIRIHLSAFKEQLCNQRRWKEAEEYQRIIDRFMVFASAQTGDCEGCQHLKKWENEAECGYLCPCLVCKRGERDYYER